MGYSPLGRKESDTTERLHFQTAVKRTLQDTQTGACVNLERWDGEGDGREVQKGQNICIPVADSC